MANDISIIPIADADIRAALCSKTLSDADYWSFKGRAKRDAAHSLIQYPAMMVPQMQGEIIDILLGSMPRSANVFDPFVGSGTVLTETMRCGKNFVGFDINPLAVLASKVKAGPFYLAALQEKAAILVARFSSDSKNRIEVSFPGREKWFDSDVAVELSKIRRAIRKEEALWARRFFWLALAELTRQASNSRTSTFKLHVRDASDKALSASSICGQYQNILKSNIAAYVDQAKVVVGSLTKGAYRPKVKLKIQDSATKSKLAELDKNIDLMVTSPPYGDNTTTVPYGQFSYLALQWIDLHDIDESLSDDILTSTHEIDARSLGGSIRRADEKAQSLEVKSPSFWHLYKKLWNDSATRSHAKRMASFTYDLARSIEVSNSYMKSAGYSVWTLGNRSTGGHTVPLADIVSECFHHFSSIEVARIARGIPYKRMPKKNNISATMTEEITLILRKE